jgi:hypothetical protein
MSLQNEALKCMSKGKIAGSGTPTHQIIQFYQPIFDKLFFLGSLKGQLQIFATGTPAQIAGNLGWTQRDHRDASKANITVNTLIDYGNTRTMSRIGTVLHEMIHAFLIIYGLPQYMSDPRFRRFSGTGYTEDGVAWQDIAYALEKAFRDPILMDVKLPPGRDISLWTEILQLQARGKKIDPKRRGLAHLGQKGDRNPRNFGCSTMPPIPGRKMIPAGIGMPGKLLVIYFNGKKVRKTPLQVQPCKMS